MIDNMKGENFVRIGDEESNIKDSEPENRKILFSISKAQVFYNVIPLTFLFTSVTLTIIPYSRSYGLVFLFESTIKYLLRFLGIRLYEVEYTAGRSGEGVSMRARLEKIRSSTSVSNLYRIPKSYTANDLIDMIQYEMLSIIIVSFSWLLYYFILGGDKSYLVIDNLF